MISPNPSDGRISIQRNSLLENCLMKLYDLEDKEVLRYDLKEFESLEQLPKELYSMVFQTGNHQVTKKLLLK